MQAMLAEEDQCHTIERKENDARAQLDIAQNIMMRILDESRDNRCMLQDCAETFIGHRAVASDSSLTNQFECVMPAAAGDESQTLINNDETIQFTAMIIQWGSSAIPGMSLQSGGRQISMELRYLVEL